MHIKSVILASLGFLYGAQASAEIVNMSTRGYVGAGDQKMISGFVIDGSASQKVIVAAYGGSTLSNFNIANVLLDPKVTLFSSAGDVIATNDDWANDTAIAATKYAPNNDKEAALIVTLAPGSYTLHVEGTNGTEGIALATVQNLETIATGNPADPADPASPALNVTFTGRFVDTVKSNGTACEYDVTVSTKTVSTEQVEFSLKNNAVDGCPVSKTTLVSSGLAWLPTSTGEQPKVAALPRTDHDVLFVPVVPTVNSLGANVVMWIHTNSPYPQYVSTGVLTLTKK